MHNANATPDAEGVYRQWFEYFRQQFATAEGSAAGTVLREYWRRELYQSREVLGAVITAALLAMLLAPEGASKDRPRLDDPPPLCDLPRLFSDIGSDNPTHIHDLDEIILAQGAIAGSRLCASELVFSRVLRWEESNYRLMSRWLAALGKASRVSAGLSSPPLGGQLRKKKKGALHELRPLVERMKNWHRELRRNPKPEEIVKQFEIEVTDLVLPWMSQPQNLALWILFVETFPHSIVTLSPAALFDKWASFVYDRSPEYVRKKFSQNK